MNLSSSATPAAPSQSAQLAAFLNDFRLSVRQAFSSRVDLERLSVERGAPPSVFREMLSTHPLTAFIPSAYGGRDLGPGAALAVLEVAGYEFLPLSLMLAINGLVFLQPVAKHASESVKREVFKRFVHDRHMGGIMLSEPGVGSDVLGMTTSFTEVKDGYRLQGSKHWGGLTGWADMWLVAARRKKPNGELDNAPDFFLCDVHAPGQRIVVEEYYKNLGLYMIPYGLNRIDVTVPRGYRLTQEGAGLRVLLDTLHRSRIHFPGMAIGFLRRVFDEAVKHCEERHVGGASLLSYDQVQSRLARIQAGFTACSAMCLYASTHGGLEHDLSEDGLPSNALKTVCTDLMQESAQSLLQLTGAKGYRLDHFAGQAIVDSRPFQIFEGSNDILYNQLGRAVLFGMAARGENNLLAHFRSYEPTRRACEHFRDALNQQIAGALPQRKTVTLGRVVSRIFTMELTIALGEQGFRADLVRGCLDVLRQDVDELLASFRSNEAARPVLDYTEASSWLDCIETSR
jgi:alkylation response protein AidB-like acyl-CoA dehydrogenase